MRVNDIVGYKINRLFIESYIGKFGSNHKYRCRCDCGQVRDVWRSSLVSKKQISCGCYRPEPLKGKKSPTFKHGKSHTSIYNRWSSMLARCENQKSAKYKIYGARGIKVCEDWHSFEKFYQDMGDPPSENHSLDRIDVDGNYEKSNCRWALQVEQQRNRRNNFYLVVNGIKRSVIEWSKISGIPAAIIKQRFIRDKLNPFDAVFRTRVKYRIKK